MKPCLNELSLAIVFIFGLNIISKTNADKFLIDKVAKFLPNNFLQEGKSLLKNFVNSDFDADKIFECEFSCPNGNRPNGHLNKKRTPNGCGTGDYIFDFDMINLKGFNSCCNDHDICYSTCGNSKKSCDDIFRDCLVKKCKSLQKNNSNPTFNEICQEATQIMYQSVQKLGCPSYGNAQKSDCRC